MNLLQAENTRLKRELAAVKKSGSAANARGGKNASLFPGASRKDMISLKRPRDNNKNETDKVAKNARTDSPASAGTPTADKAAGAADSRSQSPKPMRSRSRSPQRSRSRSRSRSKSPRSPRSRSG